MQISQCSKWWHRILYGTYCQRCSNKNIISAIVNAKNTFYTWKMLQQKCGPLLTSYSFSASVCLGDLRSDLWSWYHVIVWYECIQPLLLFNCTHQPHCQRFKMVVSSLTTKTDHTDSQQRPLELQHIITYLWRVYLLLLSKIHIACMY